jgi:hypothetical protein
VFGRQVRQARNAIIESLPLYGVTPEPALSEAYVEVIVSAVFGLLEALLDGHLKDREAAIDAITDVTAMAVRPREKRR